MAESSRIVQIFSPSKKASESSQVAQRAFTYYFRVYLNLPLFTTAIISIPCRTSEDREVESNFEIRLGGAVESTALQRALTVTKHVVLDQPLVINGLPSGPYNREELLNLFPHTYGFEVGAFLTLRVRVLPPQPWPFTVGGLPLHITTDEHEIPFFPGESGRGPRLSLFDLKREPFSLHILHQAVLLLEKMDIRVSSLFWFGGMWLLTIPERVDVKTLPSYIFSHTVFCVCALEISVPDESSLRVKAPARVAGVVYDDTLYATSSDSMLRPGIMLSSSISVDETYKSTSSGVLVLDNCGEAFVTVATQGFEEDQLVFHPNPKGVLVGKITKNIPGSDISFVKLRKGLQYTNEVFKTSEEPKGVQIKGISACMPPGLRVYDGLFMNNPYSGQCEGMVLGIGESVEKEKGAYVKHVWTYFENGDARSPSDGSRGAPIWDGDGCLVGFFGTS